MSAPYLFPLEILVKLNVDQWCIQDCPDGEGANLLFGQFSPKTLEHEESRPRGVHLPRSYPESTPFKPNRKIHVTQCYFCRQNLLYWVDAWSDSIERVDLSGGHRHSIIMQSSSINSHVAPWGIAIFNVSILPLYSFDDTWLIFLNLRHSLNPPLPIGGLWGRTTSPHFGPFFHFHTSF